MSIVNLKSNVNEIEANVKIWDLLNINNDYILINNKSMGSEESKIEEQFKQQR